MKSISFILIVMLFGFFSCKTTKPVSQTVPPVVQPAEQPVPQVNYSDASTWILGYFNINRLSQEPYSAWFIKGMDEYSFNPQSIDTLKGISSGGLSVKIVLGTWCPDSRREVPRFMRVLKEIGFPSDKVTLIGVDNLKVSPIDNYDALGIERVPTFIFYRNNIEAGRIIENPTTSLEQDMVNILARSEKH
jgi:thiol-disulfide isomerase/thioredoxin